MSCTEDIYIFLFLLLEISQSVDKLRESSYVEFHRVYVYRMVNPRAPIRACRASLARNLAGYNLGSGIELSVSYFKFFRAV